MATGSPGTNGVWQYGEDDSEATFSALLNKAASTTDTAIGLDRGRLTTLEAKPLAGLIPVAPASVVIPLPGTGSANALGQVSFTSAASISLNNVFTTAYKNYKVLVNISGTSTTNQLFLRLRAAGTDVAGSAYFQGGWIIRANGTTGTFSVSSFNTFVINDLISGYDYGSEYTIYRPRETCLTAITGQNLAINSAQYSNISISGAQGTSAAYDGFSLIASSGNVSGTVQVYGFND